MEHPTESQQAFFRQLVEHAGDLASVLEAQFASCRTEPEEHCQVCFRLDVPRGMPLLPVDTECPLGFGTEIRGSEDNPLVLLWHEEGRVDSVEIAWTIDPHPILSELQILDRVEEST